MQLYKWLTEAAKARGSAKALVYRDTYLSWRGLLHRVERRAQEFAAMGIGEGHWVGLMLGNVPDFATLALALSKLGATVVPLDPTTGARDLGAILDAAPLRGLITRPRGGVDAGPGGSNSAAAPQVVRRNGKPPETPESRRRLQGTLLTCSIYKRAKDAAPGGASVVLFTSDSSGEPKGVLRTPANLEAGALNLKTTIEVSPEDRILTTAPLYHAYGFDLGMALALRFGATLYLEDEVAPKRIVKILREQEIDLLPGTPSLYAGLAKLPTAKPLKIKHARYLAAGSALSPAIADAFRNRWGLRVMAMYHTTETQAVAVDRKGLAPDSVGKAADGVEVRTDAEGVIWVRSDAVAGRAIGSGPAPRKGQNGHVPVGGTDGDGWFRTGDLGKIDKSGRIFLSGREDDLVKVDGKRVALGEVEGCLESFAKVKAAKARVITDPLGGPMVVAKVVVLSKCGAEEIIDHCARNLAPYKVPRRIEFSEAL
jgi:long-chain acyl-CoA synthetase